MQKMILNSLLTLLFAGLFTTAQAQECNKPSDPNVLAQFRIAKNGQPISLPVKFNGKEYLFLLDTGCSHTVFDISLKDKLRKAEGAAKVQTSEGLFSSELFDAPEAFLGPLNLKDCRKVAIVDTESISSALGQKYHGIIGMNFLKEYVVQIDFDKEIVSFLKPTPNKSLFSLLRPRKNNRPDWGEEVPIKYKSDNQTPHIRANVNGHEVDFLIDSGFLQYVDMPDRPFADDTGKLETKIFKKACAKILSEPNQQTQITSQGKALIPKKSGVVARFSIGSLEYKDAAFTENSDSALGLAFLSRHLVTFDFPNGKMYLKKGKYFDRPSDTYLSFKSFNFVLRLNHNNIFVSSVDPNGLAYEKGIRQNDIIVKIDGQDVTSYSLIEIFFLISQPDRENLTITIKRGDEIKEAFFVLKKAINHKQWN
jgi:hypothetical protein